MIGRIGVAEKNKVCTGSALLYLISGDFFKCFLGSINLASDGLSNEKC